MITRRFLQNLQNYDLISSPRAADEKTVAERQWQQRKLAPKPQLPCDHGLFSDDSLQLDLVEMLLDPTNGE